MLVFLDILYQTGCPRSVQILPNSFLGSVGKHPSDFPVESMCLSHDRQYMISSCQDSCYFWPTHLIPVLPLEEDEEGYKKKKRKRKQKHRDLAAEETARAKKLQHMDFFDDLCN